MTSSFTRAVNAGHAEAVVRARMQQQQRQLLAQAQPQTEIQTKVVDPFEPLFYEEQNPLTGEVRVVEVEQKRVPKTPAELKAAQNRQKQIEQNKLKPAQKPVAPPNIAKGVPPKEVLNQEQTLLNNLFGVKVFSKTEMDYPYDADKNGNLIADKNIARLIGVARWILERQAQTSYTPFELQQMQTWLKNGGLENLTAEQLRQLTIAAQLHEILKNNEELGKKRDDAKAFAQGLGVIIQANTDRKGHVSQTQLIEDLKFFIIDQQDDLIGFSAKQLHNIGRSNAAFNLMGGSRLGTIGWKERYWDHGEQYDAQGKLINQAHHFTAFLIVGLTKGKTFAQLESVALDGIAIAGPEALNIQDLALSDLAIGFGNQIKKHHLRWQDLPEKAYRALKE